jgi:hypothetical protein
MGLDVLAPWVLVGGQHVSIIRIGSPVLVLLAGLLLPMVAVRPTFRKRPLWAVLPLVLGSLCLGGALGVLVLLSWLAPRVSLIGANSTSTPSTLTPAYSADIGLYLFLAGAALLMVSGYQFFVTARESFPTLIPTTGVAIPYDVYTASFATPQSTSARRDPEPGAFSEVSLQRDTAANAPPSSQPPATESSQPAPAPSTASSNGNTGSSHGPILPGTTAWNQPHDTPTPTQQSSLGQRPPNLRPGH